MKLKIILITFSLLYSNSIFASLRLVQGRIINANTREPLAGATVSLPDLRVTVIANENGEFTFSNVPEKGKFLIEITFLGYKTRTQTIDLS